MYLQSGELAMLDLQSFDSWIGMFAERSTEFEIDVDTSSYRLLLVFSKFHNLPELTSLLSLHCRFFIKWTRQPAFRKSTDILMRWFQKQMSLQTI
jgi:N12 class adenine-specific DNA methylase